MSTALLLIDLQNDYFPGGAMPLDGADAAVANAALLLQAFRERSLPVFHVRHVATEADATFFLPGTPGVEIHASVLPQAHEPLVTKHVANAFRETTLLADLRAAGVTKLVVAGMMTHMCVDTTVRAAADLGFACALAHDGCATTALRFADEVVDAHSVQLAYVAALNDGFATVTAARALCAELPAP